MGVVGEIMTGAELTEWAAYERVYGSLLVHERIDMGFAMLATVIARVNGNKDKEPKDFMPQWFKDLLRRTETSSTPEQVEAFFRTLATMNGMADATH